MNWNYSGTVENNLELASLSIKDLVSALEDCNALSMQLCGPIMKNQDGSITLEFAEGQIDIKPIIAGQNINSNQNALKAMGFGPAISVNGKETPVYSDPDKTQDDLLELINTELSKLRNNYNA